MQLFCCPRRCGNTEELTRPEIPAEPSDEDLALVGQIHVEVEVSLRNLEEEHRRKTSHLDSDLADEFLRHQFGHGKSISGRESSCGQRLA